MREGGFRAWLRAVEPQGRGLKDATASQIVSLCRRVESFEGDLHELFHRDQLTDLVGRLAYSRHDAASADPRHLVQVGGDRYKATANLRHAVGRYRQFCLGEIEEHPTNYAATTAGQAPRKQRGETTTWPDWEQPAEEDVLELARVLVRYVRFLHPDVVSALVADNERHREEWSARLREYGVDPTAYLWERSPCAFPGVRRYAGATEQAQFYRRMAAAENGIGGALRLDDNTYPKQVWSFVLRGRKIDKQGPGGYSLAHLADHKDYKNRAGTEFVWASETARESVLSGLYTSAANAAYVPRVLMRPTDDAPSLRMLLQRRAYQLFGAVCSVLPPGLRLREEEDAAWHVGAFDWAEPVGTPEKMENFLKFRKEALEGVFAERDEGRPEA